MGLPGAGKTYLARALHQELLNKNFSVEWFNADEVRARFNDWDFTEEGRIRQATRMRKLAEKSNADFVICDFVAPIPAMRESYSADIIIWLDTIDSSHFEDTNKLWVPPVKYDYRIMAKNGDRWASIIANKLTLNFKHQQESRIRSLTKTVTWRFTGSGSTFLISWLITGSIAVAGTILGLHFFANTILYYFHERIWNKMSWGTHVV
jgi:adenylylsulfate kinase